MRTAGERTRGTDDRWSSLRRRRGAATEAGWEGGGRFSLIRPSVRTGAPSPAGGRTAGCRGRRHLRARGGAGGDTSSDSSLAGDRAEPPSPPGEGFGRAAEGGRLLHARGQGGQGRGTNVLLLQSGPFPVIILQEPAERIAMGVFRSVSALISSGFPAIHDMTHCEFVLAKSR